MGVHLFKLNKTYTNHFDYSRKNMGLLIINSDEIIIPVFHTLTV